ncbi:MAG: aromatic amino acid lyase, partial [Saprospiraceae bacterium]|nr:aromatic amino acid lyase [Saprospiraceae bacterium]
MDHYVYDGTQLRVEDIITITSGKLALSESVWDRIARNRSALEKLLQKPGGQYYGINTGFGSLYSMTIPPEGIGQLQTNLIRSHACGVGPAVPQAIV